MNNDQNQNESDNLAHSPCIRNCCLNEEDTCLGCFRSLEEITQWNESDNQARHIILHNARLRRKTYHLKYAG